MIRQIIIDLCNAALENMKDIITEKIDIDVALKLGFILNIINNLKTKINDIEEVGGFNIDDIPIITFDYVDEAMWGLEENINKLNELKPQYSNKEIISTIIFECQKTIKWLASFKEQVSQKLNTEKKSCSTTLSSEEERILNSLRTCVRTAQENPTEEVLKHLLIFSKLIMDYKDYYLPIYLQFSYEIEGGLPEIFNSCIQKLSHFAIEYLEKGDLTAVCNDNILIFAIFAREIPAITSIPDAGPIEGLSLPKDKINVAEVKNAILQKMLNNSMLFGYLFKIASLSNIGSFLLGDEFKKSLAFKQIVEKLMTSSDRSYNKFTIYYDPTCIKFSGSERYKKFILDLIFGDDPSVFAKCFGRNTSIDFFVQSATENEKKQFIEYFSKNFEKIVTDIDFQSSTTIKIFRNLLDRQQALTLIAEMILVRPCARHLFICEKNLHDDLIDDMECMQMISKASTFYEQYNNSVPNSCYSTILCNIIKDIRYFNLLPFLKANLEYDLNNKKPPYDVPSKADLTQLMSLISQELNNKDSRADELGAGLLLCHMEYSDFLIILKELRNMVFDHLTLKTLCTVAIGKGNLSFFNQTALPNEVQESILEELKDEKKNLL